MRRRFLFLFLILMFFMVYSPLCHAAGTRALYVWDGNVSLPEDGSLPDTAIQWYHRDTAYYLMLPSGLDTNNLRLYYNSSNVKTLSVDGTEYENGAAVALTPGTTSVIKVGGSKYKVQILQSQNTASVYLHTASGNITYISAKKTRTEGGSWSIYDEGNVLQYRNEFDYIRLRGHYSFYPAKKSFHIKLRDSASILGLSSGKTYLLIANYRDNAMIRTYMTLAMAEACGARYTTHSRFVQLYLNNEYNGAYLLSEKVQIGKNRINIPDLEDATEAVNSQPLSSYKQQGVNKYQKNTIKYYDIPNNPDDITGSYLIQLEFEDRYPESACGFVTPCGQSVEIKSPQYATKEEVEYISDVIRHFENAISAEDGIDPETGKHYTEMADMESMVIKYLTEEISKNFDSNNTSFFVYKQPDSVDSKLYFAPVWDYDSTYGSVYNDEIKNTLVNPEGLYAATQSNEKYLWFPKLYAHEDFRDAVREIYQERFKPCLEYILGLREKDEKVGTLMTLDEYEAYLAPAASLNFIRWQTFNKAQITVKTGKDFHENIEYIRTFLTERMAYLDSIWLQ